MLINRPLLSIYAIFMSCALSGLLKAQAPGDPASPDVEAAVMPAQSQRSSSPTVSVTAATGVGSFQDIQVPVNIDFGYRGDGTSPTEENLTHVGFPLSGTVSASWQRASFLNDAAFEFVKIESVTGSVDTRTASYSRMSLLLGSTYTFTVLGQDTYVGVRETIRRSAFMNVSTGHYIDSAITRLTLGLKNEGAARMEAFGGAAPYARFNYDKGDGFATGMMQGTTTSLVEFGVLLSLNVHKTTWLDFSAEQERATVSIADLSEYDKFGLNVSPTKTKSKIYSLQTSLVRIGVRREF